MYILPSTKLHQIVSHRICSLKDHIDAVDINCGCPQSFASEKGIGAFILKTPDILVDLCKQVGTYSLLKIFCLFI